MRNAEEIKSEIEALKAERANIQGSSTEVYTRIVGYYRSVRNWNKGKREEFNHRVTFSALAPVAEQITAQPQEDFDRTQGHLFAEAPASYIYFFRQTCPNCPPVKNLLSRISLSGIDVDVDSEHGYDKAKEYEIMASPTVILLNAEGIEMARSSRVEDLKEKLPADLLIREEAALEV